jgi:hypothetical protein
MAVQQPPPIPAPWWSLGAKWGRRPSAQPPSAAPIATASAHAPAASAPSSTQPAVALAPARMSAADEIEAEELARDMEELEMIQAARQFEEELAEQRREETEAINELIKQVGSRSNQEERRKSLNERRSLGTSPPKPKKVDEEQLAQKTEEKARRAIEVTCSAAGAQSALRDTVCLACPMRAALALALLPRIHPLVCVANAAASSVRMLTCLR